MAQVNISMLQMLKRKPLNGVVKHLFGFVVPSQLVQNNSLEHPPGIVVGKFLEQLAGELQSQRVFSSGPRVEHLAVGCVAAIHTRALVA
jgi:hypothetical protein